MSSIEIRGATKSFGSTSVLGGVDLTIPSGSSTAILGQSGSGKTTLLRILAGFDRLDGGSIAIDGRTVDDSRTAVHAQRRGIGYVPQEGALFPHLRVAANIGFGVPRRTRRARVAELVELFGLQTLGRRFPHQLSGGQRQRVALARAVAPDPAIVLLDEPFSSLDMALRVTLRSEISDLLSTIGATSIIVTHDRDEALTMSDHVALLHRGAIHAVGSPRDLYRRPPDALAAGFLGPVNVFPLEVRDGQMSSVLVGLELEPIPPDGSYDVLLRPEQLAASTVADERATPGVIESIGYRGASCALAVRLRPANLDIEVTVTGSASYRPGDSIWITPTESPVVTPR